MQNLVSTSSQETMTSLGLRDIVNAARSEHKEAKVRNDQFISRVEDELEGELGVCKIIAHPQSGAEMRYYDLTLDQCMLVGMRESKAVRRSVLAKLKVKEQQQLAIPQTYIEALQALIESEQQKQLAIATKAEIGSRREATSMNTASQATKRANRLEIELDQSEQYATVKRMQLLYHGQKFKWQELKAASAEMDVPPIKVFDQNYGNVNSYHRDVWLEVYAIDVKGF